MKIEGLSVRRREVDLEVARVDDGSHRSTNGQGNEIDQRMSHADRLNIERTDVEALTGNHFNQVRAVEELVLLQLAFDVGERELGAIDGDVQLGQDAGQAADMVFMSVRQQNAADHGSIFQKISNIRNDDVDAEGNYLQLIHVLIIVH